MLDFSNKQMSPTGSLLNPKGVNPSGSMALPSQVPDDLEKDKPEGPTSIQSVEPQVPEGQMSPQQEPQAPIGPSGQVEVEETVEATTGVDDLIEPEDSLADAFSYDEEPEEQMDPWGATTVAPVVDESTPLPNLEAVGITDVDNREQEDNPWGFDTVTVAPTVPLTIEQKAMEEHTDGILRTLDKIAYRGVKGVAEALDFITVPGWALASTLANGQPKPFSATLEHFYPEKNYIIAEDADSYYDDILRITGTGLEFTTGGLLTAGGASFGQKAVGLADDVSKIALKSEVTAGVLSGVGYQSTLEYTENEWAAFAVAILAPFSSKPLGALTKVGAKAAKLPVSAAMWPIKKIYNFSPLIKMANPKAHVAALKVQLAQDETMWSKGYAKLGRKLIEKLPEDYNGDIEKQIAQLDNLKGWLDKAVPKGERVNAHVAKMTGMETKLNAWAKDKGLGEFKLTLDQMYKPLLKDMKDTNGLDELLEVGKLMGADAYAEQVRKNNDILYKFMQDESVPVSLKQSEEFQQVFRDKAEELGEIMDTVVDKALGENLFKGGTGAYAYPAEAMPEVIDSLNTVQKLHKEAYGAWKKTLPDVDLDVSPIANAFEELATRTGLFDDPKATPAYLRKMVDDLESLGSGKFATRMKQLDTSDDLDIQLKTLAKQRREIQLRHAKELEEAENKTALKSKHLEELKEIDDIRTDLNTQKLELAKVKRAETHKEATGEISIPRPSFTDVKDVLKAHQILSDIKYASIKAGDDKYETIKPVLDGVEEAIESLKEIDLKAYETWELMQNNYRRFVGREMRETVVKQARGPNGQSYQLSSGRAVDLFFKNAKADEIQDLLKVFDSKKGGLEAWLKIIPEKTEETAEGVLKVIRKAGPEAFAEASEEAVRAYKDVVYTDLANTVMNAVDGTIHVDPVKRLEAIDKVVFDWMTKNKDKLEIIPDLEITPENIGNMRATLGRYIDMATVIEGQQKLSMFQNMMGPGLTIQKAMSDDVTARQLSTFLEDKLPELTYKEMGKLGDEASNNLRTLMYKSLVRDFMEGDKLNYKALSGKLTEGTTSRNNLILVLGNHAVEKLDAKVALHKAIAESDITMTEALNSDVLINGLGKLGISLGRIGSLLQRRAVFQPSGGYLAGAALTKLINMAGKRETSKVIQVFMENPSTLAEFDNILLSAKNKLSPAKQARVDSVLKDSSRSLRELYPILKDLYVGEAKGYFGYLGIQLPDEEIEQAIKEVFFEAPTRVTEEEPKETIMETPEIPQAKITDAQLTDKLRSMSAEERLKLLKQLGGETQDEAELQMENMSTEERAKLTEINGREE